MRSLLVMVSLLFSLADVLGAQNIGSAALEDAYPKRLPTPPGLEDDIRFWEKIFSDYGPDECVFHDEWNLDIIYYVATVPRVPGSVNRLLKKHVKNIRAALASLEARGEPKTDLERRVFQSIPGKMRTRQFFAEARDQVRCQRGVEFEKSLARSRPYISMIKRSLREKGLPEDLSYLPHLESGFNRFATSKVGAKGLWQFMPHTARAEGLVVKKKKDWRTDPELSTDAATDHLAGIYLRTQSWELAVTAYNYGQNGVMRAIQKFGPDYMKIREEHKTKMFGFAARNYYPSFLAVRNVAIREEMKLARQARGGETMAIGDENAPVGSVTF
jgi:membrane-bound lytic murein transglycosylase D